MPHDIQQMVYVGKEPWHGLGTPLPSNGSYEEIVHAAGFYTAEERPIFSPPMEGPIPDKKSLFREDTGEYLSTVSTGYEVVQFEEVARTLVEAAGGVRCIFHTAYALHEPRLPCGVKAEQAEGVNGTLSARRHLL
ncbi:hypothetical protein SAMN05444354_1331, partial [Stigmatella aurantiaca]